MVLLTVGWAVLHQLRQSPTDMPIGQSDLGDFSIETPFLVTLGCIKMTIKAKEDKTVILEIYSNFSHLSLPKTQEVPT